MTSGPIGTAVSLALMVSLALAPTAVPAAGPLDADRRVDDHGGVAGEHGFPSHQPGLRHEGPQGFLPHRFSNDRFFHDRFRHDRFFHHRSAPFAVISSPVVVYAPPATYAAPDYFDAPVAFDPPAVMYGGYGAAPAVFDAPPPLPHVVEYATGRFELRGDGVTTSYTWVWIPNPPPAPPTAPPAEVSSGAPTSGESPPPVQSHLYRWTDAEGVLHLTDNWNAVPEEYRTQAKRNQPT